MNVSFFLLVWCKIFNTNLALYIFCNSTELFSVINMSLLFPSRLRNLTKITRKMKDVARFLEPKSNLKYRLYLFLSSSDCVNLELLQPARLVCCWNRRLQAQRIENLNSNWPLLWSPFWHQEVVWHQNPKSNGGEMTTRRLFDLYLSISKLQPHVDER